MNEFETGTEWLTAPIVTTAKRLTKSSGVTFDEWWLALKRLLTEVDYAPLIRREISFIQNDYREYFEGDLSAFDAFQFQLSRIALEYDMRGVDIWK